VSFAFIAVNVYTEV